MSAAALDDPVLKQIREALDELYGDRIERVVLFGSRARGDARPDSDYDVAVFLKDLAENDADSRWHELKRLADLRADFLFAGDHFLDAKAYPAKSYRKRSSLLGEIRRDGIDL